MKKLIFAFIACIFVFAELDACVTFDPSTGTYTVDPSGCVNH